MSHNSNPVQEATQNAALRYTGDDAQVARALYDDYAPIVMGFLVKVTGNTDAAEQLLQGVFLALPAKIREYRQEEHGRLTGWILKQARAAAEDWMKSRNAPTNRAIHSGPEHVSEPGTAEGSAMASDQLRGKVQSLIELLYVKGYTFAEAAKAAGIAESELKILARAELKKYRKGNSHA